MIEQYRLDVIKFYEQKKAMGELPVNLMHPTCASLRNACHVNFKDRCNKSEQRIIKEFLGREFNEELHESAIRRCDPDKFKPLINFLKRGIKTSEKNIELLAWLIDFQPRPYSNYWRASKGLLAPLQKLSVLQNEIETNDEIVLQYAKENILTELSSTSTRDRETLKSKRAVSSLYLGARKLFGHFGKTLFLKKENSLIVSAQKENYLDIRICLSELREWFLKRRETADYSELVTDKQNTQKEVKLEYPSGVKLYVDASDISLIEQLVRL